MTLKLDTPEDLEQYRKSLEDLVLNELDPLAEEIERTDFIPDPDPIHVKLQERELFKLPMPKDCGGYGLTFSQWIRIVETGAKGHGWIRTMFHGPSAVWRSIHLFGTEEQKKKWMPLALQGIYRGFALTEPEGGSGLDIDTTAVRKGDNYVINGRKHLISKAVTSSPNSWLATDVVARTGDKSLKEKSISIIIVDWDTPGFNVVPMPKTMGYHKVNTLTFNDCVAPVRNLIGEEGQGYYIALRSFMDLFRLSTVACTVGSCQRLLELSLAYTKKRVTFGKPIAQRQIIQQMIADMAIDVHAARLILADAARNYDEGKLKPSDSGMAKAFAVDASARVSDKAILIHGGVGYTKLYPVERIYRDIRSLWFEEGTPTIQRMMVARELLQSDS